jgi:hypothetical protein
VWNAHMLRLTRYFLIEEFFEVDKFESVSTHEEKPPIAP